MNSDKLSHFRKRLEAERTSVLNQRSEHAGRAASESDRDVTDGVEDAEIAAELATEDALMQSETNLLQKIDLALARIKEGTYGICLECSSAIPIERLEAKPSVSLCIACQGNKERHK